MKKLLFVFFTFLFSFSVYGDESALVINDVDAVVTCTGDTIVTVTLSDKTTWKIFVWRFQDYLLYDLEKKLIHGTAVQVAGEKGGQRFLINGIEVGMTKETKASLPEITSIETVQSGWWLYPKIEYKVTLSDSSTYGLIVTPSNLRHIKQWKVGDKVYVLGNPVDGQMHLINTDAPFFLLEAGDYFDYDYRECDFILLVKSNPPVTESKPVETPQDPTPSLEQEESH